MRVKMLLTVRVLGTEIQLQKDEICEADWATNQPDYEEKGLVFVRDSVRQEDVLCMLDDECVLIEE